MTIRRGEEWGVAADRPADLVECGDDAALAAAVGSQHPLTVTGGDLHRAVGSPGPRERMQRVEIDLIRVRADGAEHRAVAHVVARRRWARGRVVVVANAAHIGQWNVAPRGHPNDGRLDVLEIDPAMSLRQRWQGRRRLPQGTHLPHPMIATSRVARGEWRFERPLDLWVDGVRLGPTTDLAVEIEPDAFELHI